MNNIRWLLAAGLLAVSGLSWSQREEKWIDSRTSALLERKWPNASAAARLKLRALAAEKPPLSQERAQALRQGVLEILTIGSELIEAGGQDKENLKIRAKTAVALLGDQRLDFMAPDGGLADIIAALDPEEFAKNSSARNLRDHAVSELSRERKPNSMDLDRFSSVFKTTEESASSNPSWVDGAARDEKMSAALKKSFAVPREPESWQPSPDGKNSGGRFPTLPLGAAAGAAAGWAISRKRKSARAVMLAGGTGLGMLFSLFAPSNPPARSAAPPASIVPSLPRFHLPSFFGGVHQRKADIKFIDRIVRKYKLDRCQRRLLHDKITGQEYSEEEIEEIAQELAETGEGKCRRS